VFDDQIFTIIFISVVLLEFNYLHILLTKMIVVSKH